MSLKARITEDMKTALRGGEKLRLGTIRMLLAAIQQREIDERRELTDTDMLQVIEKSIKLRREAAAQFATAGRAELEAKELEEARVLADYLPAALGEAELTALIDAAMAAAGAASIRDMGKVMNELRPKIQGRADMSQVSALIKARLSA